MPRLGHIWALFCPAGGEEGGTHGLILALFSIKSSLRETRPPLLFFFFFFFWKTVCTVGEAHLPCLTRHAQCGWLIQQDHG